MYIYRLSRRKPEAVKKFIIDGIKQYLGPDYNVEKHFTPSYKPWDQRICLVPDGDLFRAIKRGTVTVVTDRIESFTDTGIALKSGERLTADIIVTATGLKAEIFSGMQLSVDGETVDPATTFCYKGMMLSGLPNFAFSIGYSNASWTLKSDLVGEYLCRLLKHMDKHHLRMFVPTLPPEGIEVEPMMGLTSGYVLRARDSMPKQGVEKPWKLYQNYIMDKLSLAMGSVTDSSIKFS
jgi:cation diffusion facilitator CzcD-associated flavoprotein CzcO